MTATAERIVLDTDVASRLLRGTLDAELSTRLADAVLLVTFVTVGELVRGAVHAGWGARRVGVLDDWLAATPVVRGGPAVARRWGEITGAGLRAGRPLPANDAWVAACCLVHGLALATGNVRHYVSVQGLELVTASEL